MAERAPRRWTRRAAIGAALLAAGGTALLAGRRSDRGGPHAPYFARLARALAAAGIARPVLVVDRTRLRANVAAVRNTLAPTRLGVRVVVKSLPSIGLLDAIAGDLRTDRFMAFNGPMVLETLRWRPDADLLLGKPLPATEVGEICDAARTTLDGRAGPQWLADSVDRLREYAAIARARGIRLRTNLEIDVGLHRGGFADPAAVRAALEVVAAAPELELTGLMGYDPHVPKMPRPAQAYRDALAAYGAALEVLRARSMVPPAATFNTAGSPTYRLHADDPHATEVAIGSGFVKPKDFDLETLAHHVPAAFIATPVLKAVDPLRIPGVESLGPLFTLLDANAERGFFVYGGHWLAEPESPPGLEYSRLFGRSSNQELLTGSRSVPLHPNDYVFLRPTQSEAVFLQFGDLVVYEDGAVIGRWPTFPVSA